MKELAGKAVLVICSGCTRLRVSSPPHAEHVQNLSSQIWMFVCFPAASDAASQILILQICQWFLIHHLPTGQSNKRPVPNYSYKVWIRRLQCCRQFRSVLKEREKTLIITHKHQLVWQKWDLHAFGIACNHLLANPAGVSVRPASCSTASGQN